MTITSLAPYTAHPCATPRQDKSFGKEFGRAKRARRVKYKDVFHQARIARPKAARKGEVQGSTE